VGDGLKITKLSDLKLDTKNANKGTDRGRKMLKASLEELGAGRSILADKNGNIIAGNKTAETAKLLKRHKVRVVQTTGDELVVVQRTDLDINSKKARKLAVADNRVAEIDLEWNPEVLKSLDLDLGELFNDGELRM
jgi:sporulation protein YlmC with PRC-barrel domain